MSDEAYLFHLYVATKHRLFLQYHTTAFLEDFVRINVQLFHGIRPYRAEWHTLRYILEAKDCSNYKTSAFISQVRKRGAQDTIPKTCTVHS